ncbi:MAG: hypothetical protein HC869_26140, partial [Rhodospirillales bacterium]|nr:hypothetical protein [Rhodospirillales bacterium]
MGKVYSVSGDPAFGFSRMEIETACRYRLPTQAMDFNGPALVSVKLH